MLKKSCSACAGDEPNEGKFRLCYHTHKLCLLVVTVPENAVYHVERRHSDAAPGLGGHVYVVVGDEDGNQSFLSFFEK